MVDVILLYIQQGMSTLEDGVMAVLPSVQEIEVVSLLNLKKHYSIATQGDKFPCLDSLMFKSVIFYTFHQDTNNVCHG